VSKNQTIPTSVIEKIVAHRPHLKKIADNIPVLGCQAEKVLADNYLAGETRLTVMETLYLSCCCVGAEYGEGYHEFEKPQIVCE
jgi:hypothetical protein